MTPIDYHLKFVQHDLKRYLFALLWLFVRCFVGLGAKQKMSHVTVSVVWEAQYEAIQINAKQSKAKSSKAKHSKPQQYEAKQGEAEQSKTMQKQRGNARAFFDN